MNKKEFESWLCREMPAGTIIGDPKWWAKKIEGRLRDLLEKDLAENNPPVAWFDPEHGLPYGWLEEPPTKNAVYLYLKPPIQQAPEGWQLVPKEATPEMLKAIRVQGYDGNEIAILADYRAMLSAAPEYKEDK